MLHPKTGLIITIREQDCTILRFDSNSLIDIKHCKDSNELTKYLKQNPHYPIYLLIDPPYQSVQHFPMPHLKPWDRYLYLRRILCEHQTSIQLCGILPTLKHHKTVAIVTCEKTPALTTWLQTQQFSVNACQGQFFVKIPPSSRIVPHLVRLSV